MKITILGSGGGEAYPATFCACEHCNQARRAGGKSIRTLSQTLINDDLLIDFPADSAEHARRFGLNFGDIGNILITHSHNDHFVPQPLFCRGGVCAHELKCPEVEIFGSKDVKRVFDTVESAYGCNESIKSTIHINEINAYETRSVGRYTVTALPAKHAPSLVALNYIISDGKSALLYFHDTGFPDESVIDFIKESDLRIGAVLMDSTMGTGNWIYHMSFEDNKRLKLLLDEIGITDEKTVFVANHITHNKAPIHEEIENVFSGTGILVSYDGMLIEI